MRIYQTLYVSSAAKGTDSRVISDIVSTANNYNSKNNLTGILLFRAGIFLQLLEGAKSEVELLLKKIEKDSRHSNVVRIFEIENNERIFSDWAMGYHEVSELDLKMINEFLSWNKLISAAKEIDNNLILHMLNRFKSVLIKT